MWIIFQTLLIATLLLLIVIVAGIVYLLKQTREKLSKKPDTNNGKPNVLLLVLGDIGRSPRMQYHALSFAENNYNVDFVGYKGNEPMKAISESKAITIHYIPTPESLKDVEGSVISYIMQGVQRVINQFKQLINLLLFEINKPRYILVQNPPAIPTLLIIQLVNFLLQSKLIIDWHNFGYTIMSVTMGNSLIVRVAKLYEMVFGNYAYAHLCVTKAMATFLKDTFKVKGQICVLYDQAPKHFRRLELDEIHKLLLKLDFKDESKEQQDENIKSETIITKEISQNGSTEIVYKENRPALIISSTSWTPDEDFSVLLESLKHYNEILNKSPEFIETNQLPKLYVVITGKGPLREFYEKEIQSLDMKYVTIKTVWLVMEDYPKLLGSADLGVCLHTSSSGLDLPMKVIDMFGCGLPVCAYNFECLGELVKHGNNGLCFDNSDELSKQFVTLLKKFPNNEKLINMRENIKEYQKRRWEDNWNENILPLLK
ncbi:chitobiosyldiphosphodolichol beta-mannosyltransferase-like protein [Anaeromyces robustus]|uniref:Chitobiosyldiphosphodolichol beta-mannosyltransferase n=1 Tax=Anaeromyces robustus TaxID=1754192 RepID=A0A1Y1XQS9_9FUNG|nr:chitobiosyldiphosphodolichol beta-mannosyltransferase-like protein [Anaeromyces robustus]|eukprot:ORX88087.1 chitobiosyldiphosphodolichol beta-mannosyltransferase-like protein [Anaeromyces robustus]